MDIRLSSRSDEQTFVIARNWARRLDEALKARFPGPGEVKWFEEPAPAAGKPRTDFVQYFDIQSGGKPASRLRVVWRAAEPGTLRLAAGGEGLPKVATLVGGLFGVLALVAAGAAFVLWVWFAWTDWPRIWNRVSSFGSGYDAEHATKLEVGWLLVGWIMGPVFAGFGLSLIGDWFEARIHEFRIRRADRFAREHLDRLIADAVARALADCGKDGKVTANLGQAHSGAPHPEHPNIVYDDKGDLRPAPGYSWATDDPKSVEVKPVAPA